MPCEVSFEEPRRFVVRATGDIPASEALAVLQRVQYDPRFGPGALLLGIVAGATRVPATDELTGIASAVKALFDRGLVGCVIVSQPGFVFGVARMFAVLAEMLGVHAHVTQDEMEGRRLIDELELQTTRNK